MNSQKTQGFLLLLILVWVGTFLLNPGFAMEYNSKNLIRYCAMFAIIGIAVLFVIVTGGIDLSIGSTIGLIGASLVLLLRLDPIESLKPLEEQNRNNVVWFFGGIGYLMLLANSAWLVSAGIRSKFRIRKIIFPMLFLAISILSIIGFSIANSSAPNSIRIPCIFFLLISISIHIGLLHGLLITHFDLQPFVVTLCGLLCYRGLIRWLTNDETQGTGSTFDGSLQLVAVGNVCTVSTLIMFAGLIGALFFLFKILTDKVGDEESKRQNIVMLIIGLVAGLIGSSRFWNGVEFANFEKLFQFHLGGMPVGFSTWETVVTETAAARPQYLMQICWIPMIVLAILTLICLILSIVQNRSKTTSLKGPDNYLLIPVDLFWITKSRQKNGFIFTAASVIGLVIALIAVRYSIRIASGDWVLEVSDKKLWWIKMLSVFGSLAWVMISVARLGRCITMHGNYYAKLLFPIAGLLAVLTILGKTEIAITMVQFPFFVALAIAIFAIIIFDKSVFGRYLLALGNNEDAAKFSGIDTQEIKIAAYVICSGIVGIGAIILMLASNSVAPTGFGSFYELYAIAAVVLGGCSLRGGEANVLGVLVGASIMRVLVNAPDMIDIPKTLEQTILGLVILIGVIVDAQIRKQASKKTMEENRSQIESQVVPKQ